jgi:hypothetical protein
MLLFVTWTWLISIAKIAYVEGLQLFSAGYLYHAVA